jgi:hypothetical protein
MTAWESLFETLFKIVISAQYATREHLIIGLLVCHMDARSTVREYYDALRTGDPLAPYFAEEHDGDDAFVKFGISERLIGSEQIQTGLRTQTKTTAEWTVTSHALRVCERGTHAWFSDSVSMEWTSTESEEHHEFDTRWSGTLTESSNGWQFVGMHVSTADEL